MNEIEKIFQDDIRQKKVTGYGIHHRASRKKGFKGGVHFPVDLMTSKEKREYTKPGEVNKFPMQNLGIDYVKTIAEIHAMEPEAAREYLISVKGLYTCKELRRHWNLKSDYYLYSKIYKKYNVPLDRQKSQQTHANAREIAKQVISEASSQVGAAGSEQKVLTEGTSVQQVKETIAEVFNTMTISISGMFEGQDAAERIQKLASLMQSGKQYKVTLSITE